MKDHHDVLIRPIVSEKSYALQETGAYTFLVHPDASKPETVVAGSGDSLRRARSDAIREAMRQVYREQRQDPPNMSTVVPPVLALLANTGETATWRAIQKIAEEAEFEKLRRKAGVTRTKAKSPQS